MIYEQRASCGIGVMAHEEHLVFASICVESSGCSA